jgi:hypothetical protein
MKIKVDQDKVVVHNNHSLILDFDRNNKMVVNHLYQVLVYNVDEINLTEEMAVVDDVVVKQTILMLVDLLIFDLNVYQTIY